jgi:hypothetical protein
VRDAHLKGRVAGPAAIQLFENALCDVGRDCQFYEVISGTGYATDLTLGLTSLRPLAAERGNVSTAVQLRLYEIDAIAI